MVYSFPSNIRAILPVDQSNGKAFVVIWIGQYNIDESINFAYVPQKYFW